MGNALSRSAASFQTAAGSHGASERWNSPESICDLRTATVALILNWNDWNSVLVIQAMSWYTASGSRLPCTIMYELGPLRTKRPALPLGMGAMPGWMPCPEPAASVGM